MIFLSPKNLLFSLHSVFVETFKSDPDALKGEAFRLGSNTVYALENYKNTGINFLFVQKMATKKLCVRSVSTMGNGTTSEKVCNISWSYCIFSIIVILLITTFTSEFPNFQVIRLLQYTVMIMSF